MKTTSGDRIPMNPHIEYNEDGRNFWHPGYEFRKCKHCGRDFVVAKGSPIETCGREKHGVN